MATGYSVAEIVGSNVTMIIIKNFEEPLSSNTTRIAEDENFGRELFWGALTNVETCTTCIPTLCKDGTVTWVRSVITPLSDDDADSPPQFIIYNATIPNNLARKFLNEERLHESK